MSVIFWSNEQLQHSALNSVDRARDLDLTSIASSPLLQAGELSILWLDVGDGGQFLVSSHLDRRRALLDFVDQS